jgi:hypothetical protein
MLLQFLASKKWEKNSRTTLWPGKGTRDAGHEPLLLDDGELEAAPSLTLIRQQLPALPFCAPLAPDAK